MASKGLIMFLGTKFERINCFGFEFHSCDFNLVSLDAAWSSCRPLPAGVKPTRRKCRALAPTGRTRQYIELGFAENEEMVLAEKFRGSRAVVLTVLVSKLFNFEANIATFGTWFRTPEFPAF